MADFKENEHPRDKDGKFTDGKKEINEKPQTSEEAKKKWFNIEGKQNNYLSMNDIDKALNDSANPTEAKKVFSEMIADGKVNLNVSIQKQNKHIEGTFENGREIEKGNEKSILTANAKELVNQYAGKGELLFKKKKWQHKEAFQHNRNLGIYVNKRNKDIYYTNNGCIHYSNSGVHIVPDKKDNKEK